MKSIIRLVVVISFPIVLIWLVGAIAFFMDCITDIDFHEVSQHPVTWMVAIITTICGYVMAIDE